MPTGLPRVEWGLVIGTSALFLILAWTRRFLHQSASLIPGMLIGQNRLALLLYALLMWPGTLLHEASHAVAAALLGVNVRSFSMSPTKDESGTTLGTVGTDTTDILRRTLIGLAPLLVGTITVLLISLLAFDLTQVYEALVHGRLHEAVSTLAANLSDWWGWLAVYLVFVVSANMFPSPDDLPPRMQIPLLFLPVLIAGAVDLASSLFPWLVEPTNTVFRWMLLILGFTLVIDLPILLLLTASTEAVSRQFPGD
jgi:uncharacterized membrane protein YczE